MMVKYNKIRYQKRKDKHKFLKPNFKIWHFKL